MGRVTVKEQAGNQNRVKPPLQKCYHDYRWDHLTNDHEGEKVSVQQVPQDWAVPRFHANYSRDQVDQGDGLQADKTHNQSPLLLQTHSHPSNLL